MRCSAVEMGAGGLSMCMCVRWLRPNDERRINTHTPPDAPFFPPVLSFTTPPTTPQQTNSNVVSGAGDGFIKVCKPKQCFAGEKRETHTLTHGERHVHTHSQTHTHILSYTHMHVRT